MSSASPSLALIWNIRTSGLPEKKKCPEDPYRTCRMVALSFILVDSKDYQTERGRALVIFHPQGEFTITNSEFHGITQEQAEEEGVPFDTFAPVFLKQLQSVSLIVSHNLAFDEGVFLAECERHQQKELIQMYQTKIRLCTKLEHQMFTNEPVPSSKTTLRELAEFCQVKHPDQLTKEELILECMRFYQKSESSRKT